MTKQGLVLGGLILGLGTAAYVAYRKMVKRGEEIGEIEEA